MFAHMWIGKREKKLNMFLIHDARDSVFAYYNK